MKSVLDVRHNKPKTATVAVVTKKTKYNFSNVYRQRERPSIRITRLSGRCQSIRMAEQLKITKSKNVCRRNDDDVFERLNSSIKTSTVQIRK